MPGAPYNPATGARAPLGRYAPRGTTIAVFQVIGDDPNDISTQDTHDDYVVCRGFEPDSDPRFRFLHDPYTKATTDSISVAKPYSIRGSFPYKRGQIVVAAKIPTRLGLNQGKSAVSVGHPVNLDEATEKLTDDNDVDISWLDISYVPVASGRFFNDLGETCPAWGILEITGRQPDTNVTKAYFEIAKVSATYQWNYLVNGPVPVPDNEYGYGSFLDGTDGEVLYDTANTPAYGERWGPVVDSFKLGQHRPGFHILGGTTGTAGEERVGARQVVPGEVRVKNDDGGGTFAGGATGRTFGIYGGSAGTTDTGLEVELTNGSSVSWATNKYGWATFDAGGVIFGAPHQT